MSFNPLPVTEMSDIKCISVLNLLSMDTLAGNPVLQLDPAVPGVFKGPYPIGIDPVSVCGIYTSCKASHITSCCA